MRNKKYHTKKGISLIIALFTITFLLAVSFSVSGIILRQFKIINTSISSEAAFYAADAALECALYWDLSTEGDTMNTESTGYVFGTSTSQQSLVKCGPTGAILSMSKQSDDTTNIATTTFSINYTDANYPSCAFVQIVKAVDRTFIQTRGYNTDSTSTGCDLTDAVERRIVERGMQYTH